MNKQLRGSLLLLLTAMIWGAAFVAQSVGMDHMGPLSFNGIRQIMAGLALLPLVFITGKKSSPKPELTPAQKRSRLIATLLCALCIFVSTNAQQMGLQTTAPGKAGFITALYVVLVPVAAFLFFKKNPGILVWVGVFLAVIGLWFLCIKPGESGLESGDLMVIICAFFFSAQILVVDRYVDVIDPVKLSLGQFLISGFLSLLIALFTETITMSGIMGSMIPMLYAGILSGAVGYTLQIVAQKETDPTVASLIMCLESVFAVIFGVLLIGETMSLREAIGCILLFTAVILTQIAPLFTKKKERT